GLVGVMLLAGIALASSRIWFASPQEAVAFLRGERITLDRSGFVFGAGSNGDQKERFVTVCNWTGQPVRIVGWTSAYSCVGDDGLRLIVEPRSRKEVPVHLGFPLSTSGYFWREVRLFTDEPGQAIIRFRVWGLVLTKSAQALRKGLADLRPVA